MASASQDSPQVGGIFIQVQELIAKHISNLENEKFEGAKVALQQVEEAKQALSALSSQVSAKNDELAKILKEKEVISAEILSIETKKDEKNIELEEVKSRLFAHQAEMEKSLTEKSRVEELVAHGKEKAAELIVTRDRLAGENAGLSSKIAEKQAAFDVLVLRSSEIESKIESLNKQSETLSANLVESAATLKSIISDIESAKKESKGAKEECAQAKASLTSFLAESAQKQMEAAQLLSSVLEEVKKHEDKMSADKLAAESEQMFIVQANELINQKNKGFAFVKEKLSEIIVRVVADADQTKQNELKSLLFTLEKL